MLGSVERHTGGVEFEVFLEIGVAEVALCVEVDKQLFSSLIDCGSCTSVSTSTTTSYPLFAISLLCNGSGQLYEVSKLLVSWPD